MVTETVQKLWPSVSKLEGGLIVSCQASEGEPLCKPEHIVAMSLSAIDGGARAIRLEGVENVAAARSETTLPIVGLTKLSTVKPEDRLGSVYITSSFREAKALADAGADIIALDATGRPRSDGLSVAETVQKIHDELDLPVWADVATFAEGIAACEAGADVVSTTLFGYTEETIVGRDHGPGFDLLTELIAHAPVPVVLEGRVWIPEEVAQGFELGAYAVVVGSAITRPKLITERFVRAIPTKRPKRQSLKM